MSDDGAIHTINADPGVGISLADADMRRQVGQYLDLVSATRAPDLRRMLIATTGEKQRPLFVSYISEVPVWKTTYRLVLPSAADRKPLLQGWAIIDNTIGEDWTDVELSLVAGAPQSFIQQLSQPYYGSRPVVPLPTGVTTTPQTHDAALRTIPAGFGALAGDVDDEQGNALPGASIVIQGADGARFSAVTNAEGHYDIANIPTGFYRVEVKLSGFTTQTEEDLAITPEEEATFDATLSSGALMEIVEVVAIESRTSASSLNDQQVALILAGQSLSPAAQQSLQAIRTKKAELAAIAVAQQARAKEITGIGEDQERVRENLKAVQETSGDKSLVARYTRQLATQEDRLEVLRRDSSDAAAQQKTKQAELETLIQTLSVSVDVSAASTPSPGTRE